MSGCRAPIPAAACPHRRYELRVFTLELPATGAVLPHVSSSRAQSWTKIPHPYPALVLLGEQGADERLPDGIARCRLPTQSLLQLHI